MYKILMMVMFGYSVLCAQSYEFLETRYSAALDASKTLEGRIDFEGEDLLISYIKEDKSLGYIQGEVFYKEGESLIELPLQTQQKLSQYFEVLILLHKGKVEVLEKSFNISKDEKGMYLEPKEVLKQYIQGIVLIKKDETLKEVHLTLSNNDKISISLGNEVP